jgi:hypothetical protein
VTGAEARRCPLASIEIFYENDNNRFRKSLMRKAESVLVPAYRAPQREGTSGSSQALVTASVLVLKADMYFPLR